LILDADHVVKIIFGYREIVRPRGVLRMSRGCAATHGEAVLRLALQLEARVIAIARKTAHACIELDALRFNLAN
jgi:hypothetical protein